MDDHCGVDLLFSEVLVGRWGHTLQETQQDGCVKLNHIRKTRAVVAYKKNNRNHQSGANKLAAPYRFIIKVKPRTLRVN